MAIGCRLSARVACGSCATLASHTLTAENYSLGTKTRYHLPDF